MSDAVWLIVAGFAIFVWAHFQGQSAGKKKAKKEIAEKIIGANLKKANDDFEKESNMSPDDLVDAMLDWVRSRDK